MNEELIKEYEELCQAIDIMAARKKKMQAEILEHCQPEIARQLEGKEYGAGTAHVQCGEFNLRVTLAKKVKWNQEKLASIYEAIRAGNEDPADYLKISYEVAEAKFKNWPRSLQEQFEGARTVELASPKLEVLNVENN